MANSIRVVVVHGAYGCDTGCCGHWVELADDTGEEIGFDFGHPWSQDRLEWARKLAQEMVTKRYGPEHVADLDWENSFLVEDD